MNFLTDEEIMNLILRFAAGRGKQGFTEDETLKVIEWCQLAILHHSLYELFRDGKVKLDFNDKGEEVFSLTDEGKDSVIDDGLRQILNNGQ